MIRNLDLIIAICMTLPTYIIFFFGTEKITQGLAFSLYLIPFIIYISMGQLKKIDNNFIRIWLLFLILWAAPSLYNSFNNTLESDLVALDILFFHLLLMTSVVTTFFIFFKINKEKLFQDFLSKVFFILLPLCILIFLKSFYLYLINDDRPFPFDIHPNVATEISFLTVILATQINRNIIKVPIIFISILTCYFCESRGALISSFLFLLVHYIFPIIKSSNNFNKFSFLYIFLFLIIIFINFDLIKSILLVDRHIDNIAGRLPMWKFGYDFFLSHPFSGSGFWVHPMGYSINYNLSFEEIISHYTDSEIILGHSAIVIHNAFLRIAVENGLGLLIIILSFLIIAFYKLIKLRNFSELAILTGILFFLFFATRHLTLNLLNIIFYIFILKAMVMPTNKLTNHNKEKL